MADTLRVFFTDKHFRIPNYQRDYSWDTGNVDDLIDDVIEAIESSTSHYVGTFILSEAGPDGYYNVVDGQQRLTTLIMLLKAAIKEFGTDRDNVIYSDAFVQSDKDWRLTLLNDNNGYFRNLLDDEAAEPSTRSQRLMHDANAHIQTRIAELKKRPEVASRFLEAIQRLEVMEFVESDDGKAIRMFQTVNDRGKLLTNMEKAKSLLVYYSNRFLDGSMDDEINNVYGDIFHLYDMIKSLGEDYKINVISSARFSEDSVMRYHFLAYADDYYDFSATESYVLDVYLKQSLKALRNRAPEDLANFIETYIHDLHQFVRSFSELLKAASHDQRLYKLFAVLGISTRLYPLVIRLEERGFLQTSRELLDCIETVDIRVYKVRGTDPRKDISVLARDAKWLDVNEIRKHMAQFVDQFMTDSEFKRRLSAEIYPNDALRYLFVEYSESLREVPYSMVELRARNEMLPTIDHIFPRERAFSFPDSGFSNQEDFDRDVNKLGNLTLLERHLNSAAHNKTPAQKLAEGIYAKSHFEDPNRISAFVKNRGEGFTRHDMELRTDELSEFCLARWPSIELS